MSGTGGPFPLQTLAPTIGVAGITTLPFESIFASLQNSYWQIYGQDKNLASDTQDGQWLGVLAQAIYDAGQANAANYNNRSPSNAQGAALASLVKVNGLTKQLPTFSTAPMTLVGQQGVQIPNGIVSDIFNNYWDLEPALVFPASGVIYTTATCELPGAITAGPNTIGTGGNQAGIITIIPGWQTATNPYAASPGAPVESDAALRQRQAQSTSMPAQTPRMAIQAALGQLAGVQEALVYANPTDIADANGIPPHSIAAVVEGGDETNICAVIASKKGPGTGTFGSVSQTVIDQQGMPNTIAYFPLATIPIYAAVDIIPLAGYANSTANLISAALAYYFNSLPIGADVIASRLWAPANLSGSAATASSGLTQVQLDLLSATYEVSRIFVSTTANPNTLADIAIAFNAQANSNTTNISVTLVT